MTKIEVPIYGHRWKVVARDDLSRLPPWERWCLYHWIGPPRGSFPATVSGGWVLQRKYRSEARARRVAHRRNLAEAADYWRQRTRARELAEAYGVENDTVLRLMEEQDEASRKLWAGIDKLRKLGEP